MKLDEFLKLLENTEMFSDKSVDITVDEKKEPKGKYLDRALNFLYERKFDDDTEDFYTAILKSEELAYRWFRFNTYENRKAREIVIDICDMLDHGMRLREISEVLHVNYDTVCIVRNFFKDKEEGEN